VIRDAVLVQAASFDWGPLITGLLLAAITIAGAFIRAVLKTLGEHTTTLAVLISETRPGLKLVDEVIDLKVASAELNEAKNNHEARLLSLESSRENTKNP
jgi:hypothetical protein